MKLRYLIYCLFVLCSCSKDELPIKGILSGKVYDAISKQPIEGAKISLILNSNNQSIASTDTKTNGDFIFNELTTDEYTLKITANGYDFKEEKVTVKAGEKNEVSIDLKPMGAVLSVSNQSLDFERNFSTLALDIKNLSNSKLIWSVVEDIAWLSTNPSNGEITSSAQSNSIVLKVDRTGLKAGRNSETLIIVSNGGSKRVDIAMTVGEENLPQLQVSNLFFDFNSTENTNTLTLRNRGQGTLDWSVVEAEDWLSVNPTAGTTTTETDNLTFLVNRTGLQAGRTYVSKVSIQSNGGTATVLINMNVGTVSNAQTSTQFATNIGETAATLNGKVNTNDQESIISFEYGTTTTYGTTINALQSPLKSNSLTDVNANITGLQPNTTYHFRLKIQTAGSTTYGNDIEFKTPQPAAANNLTAEYFLASAERRIQWWNGLEDQWKKAFNFVLGKGEVMTMPSDVEMVGLFQMINLTIYGNIAPYNVPILSFQLDNLRGIENLTNLQGLHFSFNQISSLEPIRNLTKLQNLEFHSNQISSLEPIKNLVNLELLYCSTNKISSLEPIKNLTNLQNLYFNSNQVSSLESIKNLAKLQVLWFSSNQISSLEPIRNLTKLQNLWFDSNQISSLEPFRNLTNMQQLYAPNNKLTNLVGLEDLRGFATLFGSITLKQGNQIPDSEIQRIETLLGITIN